MEIVRGRRNREFRCARRGGYGIQGRDAQRLAQPLIISKNKGAAFLDRQAAPNLRIDCA